MTRKYGLSIFLLGASSLLFAASGCGQAGRGDEDQAGPSTHAPSLADLESLSRDLTIGSSGEDVRTVHAYLAQYGYLPNDLLAHDYPAWRPLVADPPADETVFDAHTADAVRALQANMSLPRTGVVDAPTRSLLKAPRCNVPEGIARLDPTDKFALGGSVWNKTAITYRVLNTDDVSLLDARTAIFNAFSTWSAETNLSFTEITSGTADIQIQFAAIDGVGNRWANTAFPANGGDMTLDTAETWAFSFDPAPPPLGALDLQTVVLHEIGHALGLAHSSIAGTVMYPILRTLNRTLDIDDKVAISSLYDTFVQLPGQAQDIAIGDGAVWVVGTNPLGNGFQAYRWNGSNWDASDGGGVRVAVDSNATAWLVGANGAIYRHASANLTGPWTRLPGLARDIGAGWDGSIWIIGTNAVPGGFGIYKWNPSTSSWDQSDGGGVKITVGQFGVPWILNVNNHFFRKTTNDPFSGTWQELPGVSTDLAVSRGTYMWALGPLASGPANVAVWDEQPAFSGGISPPAPAEAVAVQGKHVGVGGPNEAIAVDFNGTPWVVDNNGNIFTTSK